CTSNHKVSSLNPQINNVGNKSVYLTLNLSSMSKGNTPTSGSTARGQFRNKSPTPQILSTSPKPPSLTTGIYPSVRIHTPIVTSKLTQQTGPLTSPELTCKKTLGVTLKKQLPVTVKSPVLPNGQYLQIPPNAQVKTLPASALPPAIKRQIFTSSMTCVSKSPMVLYVSPVQTMKQGGTPLCSTSQKAVLSLSRIQGSSGQTVSTCSTQCSTTSKDSRPPVTPIKWVIEEADGSPAPCLVPVKSTSVTSEILKTLAKMENAQKTGENPPKMSLSTQESETKIGQAKDNALVMYNGKVYFVAKKTPELCNRPSEPLEGSRNVGDSSTHTTESLGFNQKILPPSIPPTSSFGSQLSSATRRDPNHISSSDFIHEQRRSMLNQDSLKTCDRLLKQMFGIKSDVKICLERVDAKPLAIPKVFPWIGTTNKRTIEAIRKLLQGSKIVVKKREHKETEVTVLLFYIFDPGSFKPVKQKGRKSIKFQIEDKESPSVEVQFPSTVTKHGSSTAGEIPMNYFCSAAPMDPEEIKRYEKIKRLKELLKEKEAALAMIRKNMG
uniref:Ligand dependent nuclear receptor interacting factor 1 n=1 Tax=Esox lucius TaxID=8010 RepID=A0A3P8XPS9_ESOLU